MSKQLVESKKMTFKISANAILLYLELLLIIPPSYITSKYNISTIFKHLRLVVFSVELLFFFISLVRGNEHNNLKERKINRTAVFIVLFVIFQFIITSIMHSEPFTYSLNYPISILLMILAIKHHFQFDHYSTIGAIEFYFWLITIINFFTVVLFPKGIYTSVSASGNIHTNFFLGNDNQFGKIFFPGFALISFFEEIKGKKHSFKTLSFLATIICTYLITLSGAGLVTSIVLTSLYVLNSMEKAKKIISWKVLLVILVVLVVSLLTTSKFLYSDNVLMNFILDITGKNITFSNRTGIWQQGFIKFGESPLIGYGKTIGDTCVVFHGRNFNAHNIVMQILLESGVIGLILFALPVINAGRNGDLVVNKYPEIRILFIGIFTSFMYFMMEFGTLIPLFMVLIMLSEYSKSFIDQKTKDNR